MGLEHGVWDQQGLGTTPWSPVLTPSTGATIMQAEPSKFELCFIVNSKLIFIWKIKKLAKLVNSKRKTWCTFVLKKSIFIKIGKSSMPASYAMQEMVLVSLSATSLAANCPWRCFAWSQKFPLHWFQEIKWSETGWCLNQDALKRSKCHFGGFRGDFVQSNSWSGLRVGVNCGIWHRTIGSTGIQTLNSIHF